MMGEPWAFKKPDNNGGQIRQIFLSEDEYRQKQFVDGLCDQFLKEWAECVKEYNEKEKQKENAVGKT